MTTQDKQMESNYERIEKESIIKIQLQIISDLKKEKSEELKQFISVNNEKQQEIQELKVKLALTQRSLDDVLY